MRLLEKALKYLFRDTSNFRWYERDMEFLIVINNWSFLLARKSSLLLLCVEGFAMYLLKGGNGVHHQLQKHETSISKCHGAYRHSFMRTQWRWQHGIC